MPIIWTKFHKTFDLYDKKDIFILNKDRFNIELQVFRENIWSRVVVFSLSVRDSLGLQ